MGGACGPTGSSGGARLLRGGSASGAALLEPVALAIHLRDVDMVGDAVEQGAGEALAGEDRGPFLEGQVGGDDGGAVFVAPAEDIEQQLAAGLRQGNVAEFVDDQQVHLGELVLEAEQPLLVARLHHLVDQMGGGGEAHGEALLAGGEAEGQRDVRLAAAARSEQDRVLPAVQRYNCRDRLHTSQPQKQLLDRQKRDISYR